MDAVGLTTTNMKGGGGPGDEKMNMALKTLQHYRPFGLANASPPNKHHPPLEYGPPVMGTCSSLNSSGINSVAGAQHSVAEKMLNMSLLGVHGKGNRSLFLFSENNLLRRAAKAIIDWGYPLILFFVFLNMQIDLELLQGSCSGQ